MPKKSQKKDISFEESIKRLEEIVQKLEDGEVPLSDAVALYEEGIRLSKTCLAQLTEVEIKLKKLSLDPDGSIQVDEMG